MSISQAEQISKIDRDLNRILSRRQYLKGLEMFLRSEDGLVFTPQVNKILECGRIIQGYVSDEGFRVAGGDFCGQSRICRFCGQRRSTRIYSGYLPVVRELAKKFKVWRVNLSVENTWSLETSLFPLMDGWDRLIKRLRDDRLRENRFKVVGGIGSVEIKRGRNSGQWHPHVHNLIFTERNMRGFNVTHEGSDNLRSMCSSCMRQPSVVWVQECRDERGVQKGAADTLKYDVKLASLPASDAFMVWKTCQEMRLLRSFGICWGLKGQHELEREKGRTFSGMPAKLIWTGEQYVATEWEPPRAKE